MPPRRRLQQYAVAISIISIFYNTAEGVVSIVFGSESSSRSLVFYGIQSAVEVISALMVTWRFIGVVKPGDDRGIASPKVIRIERIATTCIGSLLVALAIATFATSAASLAAHETPSTALPSLVIAGSATGIMAILWVIKRYLARALNSSTMNGEALCALQCMQLSVVLLIGSLIYRFWHGGWWVDSATAIVIGLLFGWEGIKMIRWARNEKFDGGCCENCHSRPNGDEEKKHVPSSCCSSSSGCCTGSEKVLAKENCCPEKTKEDGTAPKCEQKGKSPCFGSSGCCGNPRKEAVPDDCCSKKDPSPNPCSPSGGCCRSAKKESFKAGCCSEKDASLIPGSPSSGCCGNSKEPSKLGSCSKKEPQQTPCGASSGSCGSSKGEPFEENYCSHEQNKDPTTLGMVSPQEDVKEPLNSCCGGSKTGGH